VKADVSKREEVEAMTHKAVETYGRLDCAFNNAGIEELLRLLPIALKRIGIESFPSISKGCGFA